MYYQFSKQSYWVHQTSKIHNKPDVIAQLPMELQSKENRPVVTYKLTNTFRNKFLNYKETDNFIYDEDEISFNLNTDSCDCEHSPFIDPHHKHIVTGDLKVIGNSRLRKLLRVLPTENLGQLISIKLLLK